jgi:hypothetical protein
MTPDYILVSLTFSDGTLGVMTFITAERGVEGVAWSREASAEEVEREIQRSSGAYPSPVRSWRRLDAAELPTDRTFRGAWRDRGRIEVDMPAAREIHRQNLRHAREPLLAALDVEYQRADEMNDQEAKRRVVQQKQRLRDITSDPRIEQAHTPDELKAITLG